MRIRNLASELAGLQVVVRGKDPGTEELIRILTPEVRFSLVSEQAPPCGSVELSLLGGRIRFVGRVAGFEVGLVLEMLKRLAGHTTLPERMRTHLQALDCPLPLRLWIREGCGYCVPAAALAAEVVAASPRLSLEVLDAGACSERAREDGVFAVPALKVGKEMLVGLPSPSEVVGAIVSAAGGPFSDHGCP